MRETVVVAMSGGVDSSVAAALLIQNGYDVIGVTMNLWPRLRQTGDLDGQDACCGATAGEDARRVADLLGIPHYVLNFRDIFERAVITDFVAEYRQGRTPNPCLRCNEHVKFGALLARAVALGADYIATGHYARRDYDPHRGRYLLRKARDLSKDQSYALYTLRQEQLARTLFPLGDRLKSETRRMAADLGLPTAGKAESQEICFVPDNDYGGFLERFAGLRPSPGKIIDQAGRVLGYHRGIAYYTVGQRRGLGIATGEPLYVIALDPTANEVIVGSEADLYAEALVADEVNLIAEASLVAPTTAWAKVRYRAPEAEAEVRQVSEREMEVRFRRPLRAIAPGQAVVLYQGEAVLGGGTIRSVIRSARVS